MNSDIARDYDIIILQETNATSDHVGLDDFSLVDKLGHHLFLVDNTHLRRGTLIAWDPSKIDMTFPETNTTAGFEIGVAVASTGLEQFTLISCYRSPSMREKEGNVLDFMTAVCDTLNTVQGKVILMGDLNLCHGRKIYHSKDEGELLEMIELCNVSSMFKGLTHFSNFGNNQLDYVYSNIPELEVAIDRDNDQGVVIDGVGSDHAAFLMKLRIKLDIVQVPATYVSNFSCISKFSVHNIGPVQTCGRRHAVVSPSDRRVSSSP